jgi:hypothetical protein
MCKELAAAKKKKKDNEEDSTVLEIFESAEENEESSTVLETFENAEKNTNVEEESADDEIEESHIFFEDTEDVGNKHGEEFANVEDEEGFLWFDSEINKNADTIYDILSKNIENLISSNRPSRYTGNSRMTIYRRKNKAKTDAQRNGQTLDQFFLPKNDVNRIGQINDSDDDDDEEINNFTLMINKIESKLTSENLTPDHKIRLKAVQHFLQLRKKGYAKIKAGEVVSDLMGKGKWFARCVRSWSKAFIEYGDIPKCRRGEHLVGTSILEDEDVKLKINSYLRENKFDITVSKFREYVSDEILPYIGIENKTKIR